MTRTIRCSALPMLFACARSLDDMELLIDSASGASDLGTATHDGMRSVVHGDHVDVELLARRHGVDEKELGPLLWYGRKAWEELRDSFPRPETEVVVQYKHPHFTLTGHIDLDCNLEVEGRFLDWKSGRKEESDYYAQLAGYATCLVLDRGYKSVTATVVWLRSQTIETYHFTRQDVLAFVQQIDEKLQPGSPYSHGPQCTACRRSHDCEALIAVGRRDVAIFSNLDVATAVAQASPAELVSIRRRAKMLATFLDSLDESLRRRISQDGPLDSGDGYQLALVEEPGKREVDTEKAWPVLMNHLTDTELAACVSVSAKKVDDSVGKKAGRGKGAEAKRQLAAELEAAGAVTQPTVTKLKEIRLPKQLEAKETTK